MELYLLLTSNNYNCIEDNKCYICQAFLIYRVSQNYVKTDLKDRIRTVVSSIPREMCVWALNGTVARWLLCVKHDGEQVETVL